MGEIAGRHIEMHSDEHLISELCYAVDNAFGTMRGDKREAIKSEVSKVIRQYTESA